MNDPHAGMRGARTWAAVALCAMLLAGCGTKKEAAAANEVEMRDMEVVDGTANDAMTDLDAVKADGVGIGSNAVNNGAAPVMAKAVPPAAGQQDTETVAAE